MQFIPITCAFAKLVANQKPHFGLHFDSQMNVQEVFLAAISLISALFIVVLVVCLGWYLVWKLFLSRFRLVRELLGLRNDSSSQRSDEHTNKLNKPKKVRRE